MTPRVILANRLPAWLLGGSTVLAVALFMWAYHDWWRAKPYSLATANEALALAGLAGLCIALAVGPLVRLRVLPEGASAWRRPFALAASAAAVAHVGLTLVLWSKFNLVYYLERPWFSLAGIASLALVGALAATSYASVVKRIPQAWWCRLHGLAWLCLPLVLLHVLALGKIDGWITWIVDRPLPAPQGTLLFAALTMAVIALRLIDVARTHGRGWLLAGGTGILALGGWLWYEGSSRAAATAELPLVLCGGSMRAPVEELAQGEQLRLDFGGSETLFPRVLSGAPADLIVTHEPFNTKLREAGKAGAEVEVGVLLPVLIVKRGNPLGIDGWTGLARSDVRVGLPDARYSTCGELVQAEITRRGIVVKPVTERRTHQELATDLRLGLIDAALVWNFVAAQFTEHVQATRIDGSWPRTRVVVQRLVSGRHPEAAQRLLDAWGGERGQAVFARLGYREP